jgi:tRNA (guanine-N7-)-methyltransferase
MNLQVPTSLSPFSRIPILKPWIELFGNSHPMELELGMGRAYYLFERARAAPNHNIVGIEYKETFVKQATAKKQREQLQNLHAILGHAWVLVPSLFENESLSNITLNFPDPWWKQRHHKRRIINSEFLDVLVSKLQKGGTLFLQTDVSALFEVYLELFKAHPALDSTMHTQGLLLENHMQAQSHREKKCLELEIPIYRALVIKK